MSWFLTIILLCSTLNGLSEARHGKRLPSAVVVGTVYCDTCFQADFSQSSHFISGAVVAVQCGGTGGKPSFRVQVKTNDHGEFRVRLPFPVSKRVKKIKGCSVKLISSSEPYCAVASAATSSSPLHLKSRKQGIPIFSAGFFTFKPLKRPMLCNQKPRVENSVEFGSPNAPAFPTPAQDPPMPFLTPGDPFRIPPLPGLPGLPPLPQLPPLPPLPGIPYFPPAPNGKTAPQQLLRPMPPIPLLPPPPPRPPSLGSPLPRNPFQPSPPVLPPNPYVPSPPLAIAPPLPRASSPPTLTPPFSMPLPPFPFQPSPGFPGFAPLSLSSLPPSKKISP